ncbi:MAG: cell wall hydrolase [Parvibaculales bacterium]
MLRLLEWLDLRHVWGPTGPFVMQLGAVAFLVVLLLRISDGFIHPDHIVSKMTQPVVPEIEYKRAESLFNGRQRKQKRETFAQAQRCLAQAIYFEARSEPLTGWYAVADVVINRAVSRRYPASICGVVFQGERRRHKCQFSFACDGLSDRAKDRRLWQRAMQVSSDKLTEWRAGPVMRRATHYHADYVDPYWNRDMVKLAKIGRHIFYTDNKSDGF